MSPKNTTPFPRVLGAISAFYGKKCVLLFLNEALTQNSTLAFRLSNSVSGKVSGNPPGGGVKIRPGERKVSGNPLGAPSGRPKKGSKKGQKGSKKGQKKFFHAGGLVFGARGAPRGRPGVGKVRGNPPPPRGGG